MAISTLPAFTMDAAIGSSAGATSSVVALPGTPASDALVLVSNLGPCPLACKLLVGGTGTVTPSTGVIVMPGHQLALAITAGVDHIAIVSCGGTGTSTTINLATGS